VPKHCFGTGFSSSTIALPTRRSRDKRTSSHDRLDEIGAILIQDLLESNMILKILLLYYKLACILFAPEWWLCMSARRGQEWCH